MKVDSIEYEKLYFNFLLSNPIYIKQVKRSFFKNKQIKALYDLYKKYHDTYKESPTKDQSKLLVENSDYDSIISADMIDMIYDIDLSQYEDLWLEKSVRSWIKFRNLDESLSDISEYVATVSIKPENVDTIIEKVKSIVNDRNSVNFDNNLGINALDPSQLKISKADKISSGITWVDAMLDGGYDKKSLIMYAGESGIGKSWFLANEAASFVRRGYNTVVISAEMSDLRYAKRINSNLLNIPLSDYERLSGDTDYLTRMIDKTFVMQPPGEFYIKEFPTSTGSVLDIEDYLNSLESAIGKKIQVLIVDYVNILSNYRNPNSDQTYMKIKQITEDLRGLTVRKDLLTISCTQVNRNAYDSTEIELGNIAESMGLIHTCDLIYGIIQDADMFENSEYWLKILKMRDGTGKNMKCRFTVDPRYMRITETSETA